MGPISNPHDWAAQFQSDAYDQSKRFAFAVDSRELHHLIKTIEEAIISFEHDSIKERIKGPSGSYKREILSQRIAYCYRTLTELRNVQRR